MPVMTVCFFCCRCRLQPYGVSGTQPPPGLVLEEGRDFTFTAYFGNVPATQCGQQQWQVSAAPGAAGWRGGAARWMPCKAHRMVAPFGM